jgi:hypothetical protein
VNGCAEGDWQSDYKKLIGKRGNNQHAIKHGNEEQEVGGV